MKEKHQAEILSKCSFKPVLRKKTEQLAIKAKQLEAKKDKKVKEALQSTSEKHDDPTGFSFAPKINKVPDLRVKVEPPKKTKA